MIPRVHREIPMHLINEPDAPTRQAIDPDDLQELITSMRELGQLQPGGVVPEGDRYTISYGHRRFLAAKALELPVYLAYVYESDTVAMLSAQLAENVVRADLNPSEEAIWFAQLMDACKWDTDELAQQLNRSRDYVEDRLNLLRGDARVLEALQKGRIGLGVAKLLNRYDDDSDRIVLLDAAAAGGATARLVADWIAERKKIAAARGNVPATDSTTVPTAPASDDPKPLCCLYCGGDEEVYLMVPLWIHKPCLRMLRRALVTKAGELHAHTTDPGPIGTESRLAGQGN
jgi:ParB family chromosome partitioning protein